MPAIAMSVHFLSESLADNPSANFSVRIAVVGGRRGQLGLVRSTAVWRTPVVPRPLAHVLQLKRLTSLLGLHAPPDPIETSLQREPV